LESPSNLAGSRYQFFLAGNNVFLYDAGLLNTWVGCLYRLGSTQA
jgi:hypothetical protein